MKINDCFFNTNYLTPLKSLVVEIVPDQIKSVEWYLNGIVIKPTEKHVTLFNPIKKCCTLLIRNVDKYDAGEYSCRIQSKSGQFVTQCMLNVEMQGNKLHTHTSTPCRAEPSNRMLSTRARAQFDMGMMMIKELYYVYSLLNFFVS